jgi:hypothetical protein
LLNLFGNSIQPIDNKRQPLPIPIHPQIKPQKFQTIFTSGLLIADWFFNRQSTINNQPGSGLFFREISSG